MSDGIGLDTTATVDRAADRRLSALALVAVLVVGVLAGGDAYLVRLLTLACIYGALALGLRYTFGELGELDLGYIGLFAMGGYGYGLIRIHWEWTEALAAVGAVVTVTVIALVISIVTLRLTGPFYAVTTLGFLVVMTSFVASTTDFTGGINGLGGFGGGAGTSVPYTSFRGVVPWFVVSVGLLATVVVLTHWLRASRFGDAINAVRQDPVLFRSLGYNVTLFRALAATIGGAVAGLTGAVFAAYEGFVSIEMLSLALLGVVLLTVVLGGARAPAGVLIGSFLVTLVPEYLRFVGEYRMLAFGVVLLISIRVAPGGLGPPLATLFDRAYRRLPRGHAGARGGHPQASGLDVEAERR